MGIGPLVTPVLTPVAVGVGAVPCHEYRNPRVSIFELYLNADSRFHSNADSNIYNIDPNLNNNTTLHFYNSNDSGVEFANSLFQKLNEYQNSIYLNGSAFAGDLKL